MKTINGYSKETFTDDYVLLANGGTKDLKHLLQYFDDASTNPNIDTLDNTPYLLSVAASGNYGGGTKPSGSHNGFAVLNTKTHTGNYYTQLGLDTNQNYLWIRSANNTATYGSWARLAMASELTWDSIASKPATATRWPAWSEVTDKPDTATRWPTWDEVTSKPDSFTPSSHMYHPWGSSEYYSGIGGDNNLSILTETRKFDTLRFSYGNLTNLQYHNGSSWVSWSTDVGALFDGSRNTGVTIDKTHRKFRFETVVSSSWPSNSLLVLYTGWFNSGTITKISSKYYVVVTIETRANTSASYTTADTIQFTNSYMGMLAKQVNGLHTGNSYYRITIEFASWETSNTFSFTGISLYSDFGGNPLTMIRHTGTGDVIPYSSNSLNLGTSSTYWKNVYAGAFIKKGSDNSKVLLGDGTDKAISDFSLSGHDHDSVYLKKSGGTVEGTLTVKNNSWNNILVLNRTSASGTWGPCIMFQYDGTVNGCLSMTSNKLYVGDNGSNRYEVLHSNNYTSWVNTTNFPGLNKTGTVTSVTLKAGTGISLDTDSTAITSSGTRTITNAGVRATTINGNYLRVNTNGTNNDLTIPYATSAGSASDSTKVAGYSVAFNKLYYKSKEVTMTTVQAYWYVKISLSAYAQPTQIFVSCSYNNETDRAIIEFSGMSGGFIYRNCNQNQGNIKGIWFAGAGSPWAFWLKFDKILNTSALHYSPSSSATCTVYLADNNASFNVEATTTEPSGASWISTGESSNNIIIRNAYLIGNASSATYASSAGYVSQNLSWTNAAGTSQSYNGSSAITVNGIYEANRSTYVKDIGNSTAISFKYSSGGFTSNPSYLAAWNGYQITYVAPSYVTVGNASKADKANQIKTITKSDANSTSYLTMVTRNNATNEASPYETVYTDSSLYYNPYTNILSTGTISVSYVNTSYFQFSSTNLTQSQMLFFIGNAYKTLSSSSYSGNYINGNVATVSANRDADGRYTITVTNKSSSVLYVWPILNVFGDEWTTGNTHEHAWAQIYAVENGSVTQGSSSSPILNQTAARHSIPGVSGTTASSLKFRVACGYQHTEGSWSTSDFTKQTDGGVGFELYFFGTFAY